MAETTRDAEQTVLADVERLQGRLLAVVDEFLEEQQAHGPVPSLPFTVAHAVTELLGALMVSLMTRHDPDRGPSWCADRLDALAEQVETATLPRH